MTETDAVIDRMSRAARTSLFDAVCESDLMIGLVLSNLMSPALWEFRDRIEAKAGAGTRNHQFAIMEEIAHYVNGHFSHLSPHDISDIWGLVEIEAEAVGARGAGVEHAVKVIADHNETRMAIPGFDERTNLAPFVKRGLFPEYLYTTLDIVHANRRVLKRKKHKPYGITCCADEAILISSLACVLDGVTADDIVIIGSPQHYTALVSHLGETFWFNGKREFFDAEAWAREVNDNAAGDPQAAFDARLATFDLVITPHGAFHFHDPHSTLVPERWQAIRENLARFFGVELWQIAEACNQDIETRTHPMATVSLADLDRAQSADEAAAVLVELAARHPGTAFEAAFYGFRHLDVRHPQAYVQAGLREHKTREAASGVTTLDDAVTIVRAIDGDEPVLGDRDRLALPDEVLLLNTGGDREKALLLYALLHHAEVDLPLPELVLTTEDSYVRVGDSLVNLRTMDVGTEIVGEIVFRYP